MTSHYPSYTPMEAVHKDSPPAYDSSEPEMEMVKSAHAIFQLQDFRDDDAIIAVMGMTGSGKSTFIRNFCLTAIIGEGLRSMTARVEAHLATTNISGRRVIFVDTPGFDDTERSDTDILREIVNWLNVTYKKGIKLTGIVYLHGIQVPRVGGIARTNLRLFRKLCGDESMSSVALATTHWSSVEADRIVQLQRHNELTADDEFWKFMIAKGAQAFIHDKGWQSAVEIVRYLLGKRPQDGLDLTIQQEMASGMTLEKTGAGMALEEKLDSIREQYKRDLENLRRDLDEARQENELNDEQRKLEVKNITEDMRKLEKKLKAESTGRERLRVDLDKLQREREEELQREAERIKRSYDEVVNRMEAEKNANEQALRDQIEKEKRKRKQLLENIRQAQGCTLM